VVVNQEWAAPRWHTRLQIGSNTFLNRRTKSMVKYWNGKHWVVRLADGQETAGRTYNAARDLAVRIMRRDVIYMVARVVNRG
jgi:hypothetical protein